jgi:hypothetical protein
MRVLCRSFPLLLALGVLAPVLVAGCAAPATNPEASSAAAPAQVSTERGGQEEYGPYELVANWPQPLPDGPDGVKHEGWTWGSIGAVYAETPDRIWIAMRGELPLPPDAKPWTPYSMLNPSRGNATGNEDGVSATCQQTQNKRGWQRRMHHVLFVVDRDGKMVQWWPQHDQYFEFPCGRGPHKIKMSPYDPEKHVWVIDDQLHVILKYTYDGKLVQTLGTKGKRGRDAGNLFDRPTDIAWLPDGTFFISDGYGGTRVAKYGPDDTFIMDWGGPPKDPQNPGPNEFNTVHSIAISADRKVFVIDRGTRHERMQVFDENGKFLDMWPLRSPHWPASQETLAVNHFIDQEGFIWVGEARTARVLKFDQQGNFLYSWGAPGGQPGRLGCSHGMSTDQLGNLYLADCFSGRVQKFEPIPGADQSKIAGQILRTWDTWKK